MGGVFGAATCRSSGSFVAPLLQVLIEVDGEEKGVTDVEESGAMAVFFLVVNLLLLLMKL